MDSYRDLSIKMVWLILTNSCPKTAQSISGFSAFQKVWETNPKMNTRNVQTTIMSSSFSMSKETSLIQLYVLKVCSYTVTFREQFCIYPCSLQCHLFLYPHLQRKFIWLNACGRHSVQKPMDKPHLLLQKPFYYSTEKHWGKSPNAVLALVEAFLLEGPRS